MLLNCLQYTRQTPQRRRSSPRWSTVLRMRKPAVWWRRGWRVEDRTGSPMKRWDGSWAVPYWGRRVFQGETVVRVRPQDRAPGNCFACRYKCGKGDTGFEQKSTSGKIGLHWRQKIKSTHSVPRRSHGHHRWCPLEAGVCLQRSAPRMQLCVGWKQFLIFSLTSQFVGQSDS